jgi:hypothetical protein
MKYAELVARVRALPGMDDYSVRYLISRVRFSAPGNAAITLVAHRGGTYTATLGDARDTTTPYTDADGQLVVFPDEAAACEWAWGRIRSSRSNAHG